MLVFVHRLGKKPSMFLQESKTLFERLHIQPMNDLWIHYIPDAPRTTLPFFTHSTWGGVERFNYFVAYLFTFLCVLGRL